MRALVNWATAEIEAGHLAGHTGPKLTSRQSSKRCYVDRVIEPLALGKGWLLEAFEDGVQQVRLPADKKIGLLQ
jgi:hypothetical protein